MNHNNRSRISRQLSPERLDRYPPYYAFSEDEDDDDEVFGTTLSFGSQEDDDAGEAWIDLSKLGSVFSHEGSSLYLRFGELSEQPFSYYFMVSWRYYATYTQVCLT